MSLQRKGHAPMMGNFVLAMLLLLCLVGPLSFPLVLWDWCAPLAVGAEGFWLAFLGYYYVKWAMTKSLLVGIAPVLVYVFFVALVILLGRMN